VSSAWSNRMSSGPSLIKENPRSGCPSWNEETPRSNKNASTQETQISHLRPGQPVEIDIDSYPNAPWQGRVESIGQASGSEFAILPAQNATGNWVKVVQRIPVRIALQDDPGRPPLRAGMSATVIVDTGIDKR